MRGSAAVLAASAITEEKSKRGTAAVPAASANAEERFVLAAGSSLFLPGAILLPRCLLARSTLLTRRPVADHLRGPAGRFRPGTRHDLDIGDLGAGGDGVAVARRRGWRRRQPERCDRLRARRVQVAVSASEGEAPPWRPPPPPRPTCQPRSGPGPGAGTGAAVRDAQPAAAALVEQHPLVGHRPGERGVQPSGDAPAPPGRPDRKLEQPEGAVPVLAPQLVRDRFGEGAPPPGGRRER